jgi:hypothetical protein
MDLLSSSLHEMWHATFTSVVLAEVTGVACLTLGYMLPVWLLRNIDRRRGSRCLRETDAGSPFLEYVVILQVVFVTIGVYAYIMTATSPGGIDFWDISWICTLVGVLAILIVNFTP